MDILLIGTKAGTEVRPASVHGMLWLQTHFEDFHWDALAANQVRLPKSDANDLATDALKAGVNLNFIPELSVVGKF